MFSTANFIIVMEERKKMFDGFCKQHSFFVGGLWVLFVCLLNSVVVVCFVCTVQNIEVIF